jgi:hypothetical protein
VSDYGEELMSLDSGILRHNNQCGYSLAILEKEVREEGLDLRLGENRVVDDADRCDVVAGET